MKNSPSDLGQVYFPLYASLYVYLVIAWFFVCLFVFIVCFSLNTAVSPSFYVFFSKQRGHVAFLTTKLPNQNQIDYIPVHDLAITKKKKKRKRKGEKACHYRANGHELTTKKDGYDMFIPTLSI